MNSKENHHLSFQKDDGRHSRAFSWPVRTPGFHWVNVRYLASAKMQQCMIPVPAYRGERWHYVCIHITKRC